MTRLTPSASVCRPSGSRIEATWLVWPQTPADWPGKIQAVRWVYTEVIRHLYQQERVRLIVNDGRTEDAARRMIDQTAVDSSAVTFHRYPTDRSWVRDSGPLFVRNDTEVAAVCWGFNGWARYRNWQRDARVSGRIGRDASMRRLEPRLRGRRVILEGGAIDVNGRGTLLTTEECLLGKTQERNPGMNRDDYEALFHEYLGVQNVLWLGKGIAGDDTHGHVDDLARFVGPQTVVAVVEGDRRDENYAPLHQNLRRLRSMRDQAGRLLEVVELPMPKPLYFQGCRLPASYANFYIANGVVLVPTFNDTTDRVALGILAKVFPDREVIGIHGVDLVWGFGTLHCLTQQQPSPPVPGASSGEDPRLGSAHRS